MDPTSACNLHCIGCWSAEYGNRLNMSYEQLDSIINQANKLDTYCFLYSGGEPLVRKAGIIRLCEAHPPRAPAPLPAAVSTCASMPTETTSRARSSTTPTPTCAPIRCSRPCGRRCSPSTARASRGTATTCARARCSTTPEKLVEVVWSSEAHSTDLQAPEDVEDAAAKYAGPAARWAKVADELWAASPASERYDESGTLVQRSAD